MPDDPLPPTPDDERPGEGRDAGRQDPGGSGAAGDPAAPAAGPEDPSGDAGATGGAGNPGAGEGRPTPGERGLLRSTDDRVLFGVCGGIAERYGLDALLVRIAFVVATLFGGSGLLFYLAAALLIPSAAPAVPAGEERDPATTTGGAVRLLVGIAVGVAVLTGLLAVAAFGFGVTVLLGGWPVAVLVVLLGMVLLAVARNRRASGALLLVIAALALPAAVAVLADVRVDRSIGEVEVAPLSARTAARPSRLGIGDMTLDLRELDVPRRGLRVPARVDIGRLLVLLPRNRCVTWRITGDVHVAGEMFWFGRSLKGPRTWLGSQGRRELEVDPGGRDRPVVELDLRVGVGQLEIGHGPDRWDEGRVVRHDDVSSGVIRTAACEDRR